MVLRRSSKRCRKMGDVISISDSSHLVYFLYKGGKRRSCPIFRHTHDLDIFGHTSWGGRVSWFWRFVPYQLKHSWSEFCWSALRLINLRDVILTHLDQTEILFVRIYRYLHQRHPSFVVGLLTKWCPVACGRDPTKTELISVTNMFQPDSNQPTGGSILNSDPRTR